MIHLSWKLYNNDVPARAKWRHFGIQVKYHFKWLNNFRVFFFKKKNHAAIWLKIMNKLCWQRLVIWADYGPNGAVLRIKANHGAKWLDQNFTIPFLENMLQSFFFSKICYKYLRVEIVKMFLNPYCITLHIMTKEILFQH